jgi:multidrug efflux pump subunit AcrB
VKATQDAGGPAGWAARIFDNRYLLGFAVVVTLAAGLSALKGLPRLEDPVITNRNPQILTAFPGASAERVEAVVTEPVERVLREIDEVKFTDSTSRAGISVVTVELEDTVTKADLPAISSEIRDRLAEVAAAFPPEVAAPIYDDQRNAVAFTAIFGLRWSDGAAAEESLGVLARRAEVLADELRRLPGTEVVRVYGMPAEEWRVELKPERLTELGLRPRDVAAALQRADAKVPAGQMRGPEGSLLIEVEGRLDSQARIREVMVLEEESRTVRVGDVAEVRRAWTEPEAQIGLRDGQRAIFVAARLGENQRVDQWDARVDRVVTDFRDRSGSGIAVEAVFRQSDYTTERLAELAENLVLGCGVVMAVILLTMGWRRAMIVGAAVPLTAAATLFVVSAGGGQLHQMSIFGMIIALGLLVDTAIVITDEVRKLLAAGNSRREAVVGAVRHLFVPLLASTLTTVLSFLPILLMPGAAGDFISSIGESVVIAVLLSFLYSVTVIVTLAGLFSALPGEKSRLPKWLREGMEWPWFGRVMGGLIRLSARRPWAGIGIGVVIPVLGFAAATQLGSQFFPRTDRDMFVIEARLPTGAAIERTERMARAIEEKLRSQAGVGHVDWLIGASFPPVYYNLIEDEDGAPEFAMAVVKADSYGTVDALVPRLQRELALEFPQAVVKVAKFAQGPPAEADIELRLVGPSLAELQRLGDEFQRRLAEHPKVTLAETSLPRGEPKWWFEPLEEEARAAGLELAEIADQLESGLEGVAAGTVLEGVKEVPVRVRYPDEGRRELARIADLRVVGEGGVAVPLRALGEFQLRPETGAITRRSGERMNWIFAYVESGALAIDVTEEILADWEAGGEALPAGYRLEVGGEAENQGDAVGQLILYLPVILVVTAAVLVLSFRSLRQAAILGATAVLSIGFGLLATWAMDLPVSFNTILGCIGLAGLAFNDNIVSLAAIQANPAARAGDPDAIADEILGCGRHLLSTTLTTIGSFLPLLVFVGGQFWPPLAIVLAGGVGGATLLAATFTPATYRWFVSGKYRQKSVTPTGVAS